MYTYTINLRGFPFRARVCVSVYVYVYVIFLSLTTILFFFLFFFYNFTRVSVRINKLCVCIRGRCMEMAIIWRLPLNETGRLGHHDILAYTYTWARARATTPYVGIWYTTRWVPTSTVTAARRQIPPPVSTTNFLTLSLILKSFGFKFIISHLHRTYWLVLSKIETN